MFQALFKSAPLFILLLGACSSEPLTVCEVPEGTGCPQCLDGVYTCSYDGVEVTSESCGECGTRIELHEELCAQGSVELRELVEEQIECTVSPLTN